MQFIANKYEPKKPISLISVLKSDTSEFCFNGISAFYFERRRNVLSFFSVFSIKYIQFNFANVKALKIRVT
jgi:hypothetical protein